MKKKYSFCFSLETRKNTTFDVRKEIIHLLPVLIWISCNMLAIKLSLFSRIKSWYIKMEWPISKLLTTSLQYRYFEESFCPKDFDLISRPLSGSKKIKSTSWNNLNILEKYCFRLTASSSKIWTVSYTHLTLPTILLV